MKYSWTLLSFPAGAQRRGRESIAPRVIVDPLPSLTLAGDDKLEGGAR
ncbi:hypothetical protein SAMN02927923_04172 [Microvirga guangxiensis]|uniref:Uncharacterized protein n=1 Tax=Microvirga guangxiensis TaxID=549386 RepID=A0A1G5LCE4_9HYPH|nr:hypothetical protein SAMN02927923_04172 [Microvirga guangxiensis]